MIRPPVPVTLLLVLLWGPIFGTCLRPPGPSLSGVNRNLPHKSDIGFWHRQLQAGNAGEGGEEGQLCEAAALQLLLDRASSAGWHLHSLHSGPAGSRVVKAGFLKAVREAVA